MHVPFTQKILEDWAGHQTFRDGLTLFERGKVDKVTFEPPFVTGHLSIGVRGMRSKFEVLADGLVENHCPCRENREEGKICAHLVALGLEAVRCYSDPHRVDKMAEEKRRAERLASFDDSAYHTRDPEGTPALLRLTLKQSWRDHLPEHKVPMRCAVEIGDRTTPLNEIPKDHPLALNQEDENLLFVLEDICEGPARGKLTASIADFVNILELRIGGELYEGGIDGCLIVDDAITTTLLEMVLDEGTGELVLTIHVDGNKHKDTKSSKPGVAGALSKAGGNQSAFIVSGGSGWMLQDGIFNRLETVLPGPMRAIYDAPIRIPRDAIPSFMKNELPMLEGMIRVECNISEDMLSLRPAKPRFRLVVDGTQNELSATLYAEYGKIKLFAGKDDAKGGFSIPSDDDLLEFQIRNPEAEKAALDIITEAGFRGVRGDMLRQIRGNREVLNFLGGALPRLRRMGWRIDIQGMAGAFMDQAESVMPVVHVNPSSNSGFFEVGYEYETQGGQSLDETDIQRAINMGEAFIEKKGRVILLDSDAIETARNVFSDCAVGAGDRSGSFRMSDMHAAYVQSSLNALDGIDVEGAPEWTARAEAQNRDAKMEPVPLGDRLEGTLRDYQKQGVYWMRFLERSGFCGILADEMGLGKTLQTLTWLQLRREDKDAQGQPALIICPTSLVDNWAEEAEKFTPRMGVLKMHGGDRHDHWEKLEGSDLVITSYALIRRDLDEYLNHRFSALVLDEAQHIKNRTTQNATTVKQLQAFNKLVLTGTPIENGVSDLWSIMDFLMPGYLGHHKTFRESYELPIHNGGPDADLAQIKLRRKLHPFLLRRLKKEVAKDLPDKIVRVAHCSLSKDQHMVYKKLLESAKKEITSLVDAQGFNKSRMQILKILLQLRQTCCHLDLLKIPDLKSKYPSAKMELFFELVDEALDAGHRILVFSQFTSMLSIIREELEMRDLKYCYLDGSTKDRQKRVRQFNSDRSIPIFLISLKAGGSGLNLTGADMVIHFDPWWNPAVEDQATDRAHRIGQKNTVYSIKLITRNTVEEKVLQMQRKKKSVIDATLEQESDIAQSLTWNDVQELLAE